LCHRRKKFSCLCCCRCHLILLYKHFYWFIYRSVILSVGPPENGFVVIHGGMYARLFNSFNPLPSFPREYPCLDSSRTQQYEFCQLSLRFVRTYYLRWINFLYFHKFWPNPRKYILAKVLWKDYPRAFILARNLKRADSRNKYFWSYETAAIYYFLNSKNLSLKNKSSHKFWDRPIGEN